MIDNLHDKEDYSFFLNTENIETIDLGLSVLWGDRNLGAVRPEENGDYYAWGETSPKLDYSWDNYRWCQGSKYSLTKYNNDLKYGPVVDDKLLLETQDDAAFIKLGSGWHMPSEQEAYELIDGCSWKWLSQNGLFGYRGTSRINGNQIFLPASGSWSGKERPLTNWLSHEPEGRYLINERCSDVPYFDSQLSFSTSKIPHISAGPFRCAGLSIRPIYVKVAVLCIIKRSSGDDYRWWICKCEKETIPEFKKTAVDIPGLESVSFFEIDAPCLKNVESNPCTLYGWGGMTYAETVLKMASYCKVDVTLFDESRLKLIEMVKVG